MNETLTLALAWLAGGAARGNFLRWPLVDGAPGCFVPATGDLVLRQSAAADVHRVDRILFCRARELGAACGMSPRICHRTFHRDAIDPYTNPTPQIHSKGDEPCALVPTK